LLVIALEFFDGRCSMADGRNKAKTPFINRGNSFLAGFVDAFSAIGLFGHRPFRPSAFSAIGLFGHRPFRPSAFSAIGLFGHRPSAIELT
jgi:hypothetical protein